MSILSTIRKHSRTIAKGSLYVAGGLALGYPLIKGAQKLWDGETLESAAGAVVFYGTGYSMSGNALNTGALKNAVVRDIVGVGAIYVGSKL